MGRCVLVMGTGRSGTSAVAGVLHRLGCCMGRKFVAADRNNQWGTYEDKEFFDLTRKVTTGQASPAEYKALIVARNQQPTWGIKDPGLVGVAQLLTPMLDDVRVVVARRPRHECIDSYMRAYRGGRLEAEQRYETAIIRLAARILEFEEAGIPVLGVNFRDLLADPLQEVSDIAHFAFEEPPTQKQFNDAVASVKVKPKRKVKGWGDLAIGVRIAKHPEPGFFVSWTALLTGGVRPRDTVLQPQCGLPAHWAANEIARKFLHSDKDSLLLVDDDMVFPMDALHQMRENQGNWEYDLVMGLAVRRNWREPTPVVMRYMGDPPMPQALRGDHFESEPENIEGVIEVDAVGLAFTLIRRHVLEAMSNKEWGLDHTYDFFAYGPGRESDDIPFSRRCRAMGFRMAVDATVKIGHLAAVPLGWDDYMNWLKQDE